MRPRTRREIFGPERSRARAPERIGQPGYIPGYANAALRLLPAWTQWCIEQSGLTGDLAARSPAPPP